VREICEPLGAKPTLERVDAIEALLPKTRRSNEEHAFGLTGREVEVLRLVARGRTDAEAAEELFISPRTASQHLRNAYNKLGVSNRAEATRVAVEAGIV
jgi:DNA-binding NarL/FixJ family response regulator